MEATQTDKKQDKKKPSDTPVSLPSSTLNPVRARGQRMGYNEFAMSLQQKGKTDEQIKASWELYCEPKSAKFRRLANSRRDKACKAIESLVSLANTSQYEYTDVQAERIVKQLTDSVQMVRHAFAGISSDKQREQI